MGIEQGSPAAGASDLTLRRIDISPNHRPGDIGPSANSIGGRPLFRGFAGTPSHSQRGDAEKARREGSWIAGFDASTRGPSVVRSNSLLGYHESLRCFRLGKAS
jgi:hypothetical protein